MYERAKYKDNSAHDWAKVKDPVGTKKFDGGNFWMRVEPDGSLRYFSRRESVKGGFPERTNALPHLTDKKLPQYSGNIYNVELIHSGHSKKLVESHSALSGILNSLPPKAIATQKETGPVRAVLHNVIDPYLPTYKDKLLHMKEVQDAFGKPDLLYVTEPHVGLPAIRKLIEDTRARGEEGAVVTSLTEPEMSNTRIKIVHKVYYNLRIVGFEEELDKNGVPKNSLGSIVCADSSGRIVGNVGTGFSKELRKEIWNNKPIWRNRIVQIKSLGLASQRLRGPVYNGIADGDVDKVLP